jgi:hypothetical protein
MIFNRAVRSIVWTSGAAGPLTQHLEGEIVTVGSASDFLAAPRDGRTFSFVDGAAIEALDVAVRAQGQSVDAFAPPGPMIALCDGPLQTAVRWLPDHPWLSHVIGVPLLGVPGAGEHLKTVMRTITSGRAPKLLEWLGERPVGRHVRLAHAARRSERLDRMSTFFEEQGVPSRTLGQLRDVAEELLTNAFYDAPVAAGMVQGPISRTRDVSLPEDAACSMVYACSGEFAMIRVRDPFGAFKRIRLVEVLSRCAQQNMQVTVDETMGGAGLGLWRLFSVAAFVAISVINHRQTEFLVGRRRRRTPPRPFAFHQFFKDRGRPGRRWRMVEAEPSVPTTNRSITIVND